MDKQILDKILNKIKDLSADFKLISADIDSIEKRTEDLETDIDMLNIDTSELLNLIKNEEV